VETKDAAWLFSMRFNLFFYHTVHAWVDPRSMVVFTQVALLQCGHNPLVDMD
jgi:hypothetical protein